MTSRPTAHLRLAALALATALVLPVSAAPDGERGPARVAAPPTSADTARVIVRFKASAPRERALAADPRVREPALRMARVLSQRHGITLADGASVDPQTQVVFAHGIAADALAQRLAGDADVEWVQLDRRQRAFQAVVPNDPLFPAGQTAVTPAAGQWVLRTSTASEPAAIDAQGAWALTRGASGIVVAVIDTGVRFEHPDLGRTLEGGKLLPGYDFVSDAATANDGDGRDADPSDPGDWITAAEDRRGPFEDCGESDSSWHGTQTAGLVGAMTNNALGIAGTGWDLNVLPVRALGKCGGFVSDIAAGIRWAAGLSVPGVPANPHPARVVNLSLGSANRCDSAYQAAIDAVRAAGVVVVAAAGNEGVAVNQPGNCVGVVTVAGVRHVGTKVGYSNLGPEVTLAAPAGNCVNLSGTCLYPLVSTSNAGTTVPAASTYTSGGDDATLGTSFASPLAAATAGLMLSVHPALVPDAVATRLRDTARAFPPSSDPSVPLCRVPTGFDDTPQLAECVCTADTCGAGLLDAGSAVAAALRPQAVLSALPASAEAGETLALDASASSAASGRQIVAWRWALADDSSATAEFAGPTDGPAATLSTSSSGTLVVALTVTDSAGATSVATGTVVVNAASSGGGASGAGFIAALALATFVLHRVGRRRHTR
jgi:serine protease